MRNHLEPHEPHGTRELKEQKSQMTRIKPKINRMVKAVTKKQDVESAAW